MTTNFPTTNFYTLNDLDIDVQQQVVELNIALLDRLNVRTLTAIKNSFSRGVLVWQNGLCYISVSELKHLLRTGNSGAEKYYWQHGIQGYTSPSAPYSVGEDIYISGPDFAGLLDARIQSTVGTINIYLRYVRALYMALTSSSALSELRSSFVSDISIQRSQLKSQRIRRYGIRYCEFTGQEFHDTSEVQFAHVESVTTSPFHALNIDNGVIILTEIHAELTRRNIHDFAGMYDYCVQQGYSTYWAENYNL